MQRCICYVACWCRLEHPSSFSHRVCFLILLMFSADPGRNFLPHFLDFIFSFSHNEDELIQKFLTRIISRSSTKIVSSAFFRRFSCQRNEEQTDFKKEGKSYLKYRDTLADENPGVSPSEPFQWIYYPFTRISARPSLSSSPLKLSVLLCLRCSNNILTIFDSSFSWNIFKFSSDDI